MRTPKTWADIVSEVENSGMERLQEEQKAQRLRSQMYREGLLDDIGAHRERQLQLAAEKKRERSLIDLKAYQDLQKHRSKRQEMKQMHTRFRDENHSLFIKRSHEDQTTNQLPKQHPFVALMEQEDSRRAKRAHNAQQSSNYNQMLQNERSKDWETKKQKQLSNNFEHIRSVNNLFSKIDNNRKQYENKYLRERSSRLATQPDSLQHHYAQFLNQQIQQKNQALQREQYLNKMQGDLNSHLAKGEYSPAFIGRVPYNQDRKKQLDYLNRTLLKGSRLHKRNRTEATSRLKQESREREQMPQETRKSEMEGVSKSEVGQQRDVRTFRQFNLLTGGVMYRQV